MQKKRAERFGEVVKDYQRYRKSHPKEIFDKFFSLLSPRSATVLDLACGSGKSTEPLVRKGIKVIGCDPDRRMLSEAKRRAKVIKSPIRYLLGRAEKLPFKKDSFDAVTVGSAFHWFANKQTTAEMGRVLKLGGLLYTFIYQYPTTDREDEFNEEASLFRKYGVEYPPRERLAGRPQFFSELLTTYGFEDVQTCIIRKMRRYTINERVGRIRTLTAYRLLSPVDRKKIVTELTGILKEKWRGRKHRLIPQIVNICYGYKPKYKAAG